jgi:hypothetical protein
MLLLHNKLLYAKFALLNNQNQYHGLLRKTKSTIYPLPRERLGADTESKALKRTSKRRSCPPQQKHTPTDSCQPSGYYEIYFVKPDML